MDEIQLEDLRKVQLSPEDVIVLCVNRMVSDVERMLFGRTLRRVWPNNRSLVVDDDMELFVVVKEVADG